MVGSIEAQVIDLAKQGFGRPTIVEKLDGEVTDWQVRTILAQLRTFADGLEEEEKERISRNVRPTNFEVISTLRPLEISVPRNRKIVPTERVGKKVIFVSDTHAPFEDPAAVEIACQIISDEQPDILVHLGDLVDFYTLSRYERDPTRRLLLQDELEAAGRLLAKFDQAVSKDARKIFIPGNHERRLQKYLASHAPALVGLPQLQLDNLLGLHSLGWEFVPHDLPLFSEFLIKHGEIVRQHTAYTARGELDRAWMSGISGHTHRLGTYTYSPRIKHLREQQPAIWIENGCLCSTNPEWMEDSPNWQQGFSIVNFYDDGIVPELVHIVFGKAVHRGRLYKA